MLSGYLQSLYAKASIANREHILNSMADFSKSEGVLLDIGCDDGVFTLDLAAAAQASRVCGVEIVEERGAMAGEKGIDVRFGDIMSGIDFPAQTFDVIHANQVIEHVSNVDFFASEIKRLLRPGGVAIISTENASSWCNIGASILGWQQFSLTNVSALENGVGNPWALHRGDRIELSSWTHKTVFNYRGLIEFLSLHGLTMVSCRGAGYFPFPWQLGRWDPRHAHFLTLVLQSTD